MDMFSPIGQISYIVLSSFNVGNTHGRASSRSQPNTVSPLAQCQKTQNVRNSTEINTVLSVTEKYCNDSITRCVPIIVQAVQHLFSDNYPLVAEQLKKMMILKHVWIYSFKHQSFCTRFGLMSPPSPSGHGTTSRAPLDPMSFSVSQPSTFTSKDKASSIIILCPGAMASNQFVAKARKAVAEERAEEGREVRVII